MKSKGKDDCENCAVLNYSDLQREKENTIRQVY